MRPAIVTVGPITAGVANSIALTQTPSAGALTLNGSTVVGGVAVLDAARQVLITTTGNEVGKTFTITGTNWSGSVISEVVQGVNNSTATSVLDYATVTSIVISANAANALTVGTNGVAGSPWVRFDDWAPPNISIQVSVSGTVNFTVQQTLDDPNNPTSPIAASAVVWINHPDSDLVAATGSVQGNYAYAPIYARVVLNSGTGSIRATFLQSGDTPA